MFSSITRRKPCLQRFRFFSQAILTPADYKKNEKNPLKKFIVDKIRTSGPITVAEYMKTVVSAPSVGYYGQFSERQQVFGASGDFITAPELTQLFGEMIGVWVFHELANTGHRGKWQLVELGPGRGQLMRDILESLDKFQDRDVSVHLVETSDALIQEQERTLCVDNSTQPKDTPYVRKNKSRTGADVFWYKSIDEIPEGFTVFVGNEFLDALPIHQFQRGNDDLWREIYVNIDSTGDLCLMQSKSENLHTKGLLPETIRDDKNRKTWECSPEAGTVVNQIAERIVSSGGFGLLVDYGHDGSRNTHSFRAYSKHKQVSPVSDPGRVDLTADVDFGYLKSLVSDRTVVYGPTSQREFLLQLGIEHRLRRLLKTCSDRQKQENLIKSYNMLMGDMGEKFKAMALFPKTLTSILEARGGAVGFVTAESKTKAKEASQKASQDDKK
ncbi:unnamed protein product [Caenorhabditis auriculariae]|uniref:Protein arginine methyltransferase NDUFAF7 n=1 Tax=Caenorhabditis auriculariae TaxID=2777116 RepID=A0A8S1HVJ9_9PELO|nr:unnamed protein product [Caenorhabditis auriculariae]